MMELNDMKAKYVEKCAVRFTPQMKKLFLALNEPGCYGFACGVNVVVLNELGKLTFKTSPRIRVRCWEWLEWIKNPNGTFGPKFQARPALGALIADKLRRKS
jgi:hypothetical protein